MARNPHGTHSDLIHCDNCGEDYSSTYKRCPFCGARPASTQSTSRLDFTGRLGAAAGGGRAASSRPARSEQQSAPRSRQIAEEDDYVFDGQDVFDDPREDRGDSPSPFRASGGRHLSGGGRDGSGLNISPTTLISFVVSGIIVLAAILIVILVVIPIIKGGKTPAASNSPNGSLPGASASQPVSPSPGQTAPAGPSGQPSQPAGPSAPTDPAAPTDSPLPSGSVSPSPSTSVPPSSGSITLRTPYGSGAEISISDAYPTPVQLQAVGASGNVTWKSANTAIATVSASGVVSGVSWGDTYITATDAAGNSQTCHVIVRLSGTAAPSSSPAPSNSPAPSQSQAPSSGALTLSHEDFTMSSAYPTPITIRATGASGAVTWASSNTSVATVDANGKVSMVGKGQCRITATDAAGNSASCIVRVS